jgi:hypothetical protein
LLKQVDVVGSRGRNWPIRDAKDQAKLITDSIAAHGVITPPSQTIALVKAEEVARSSSPNKRHIQDPHASLSLFANAADQERAPPVIAPRAAVSSKPAARGYNELFVRDDEDEATPTKNRGSVIAPKVGAGKSYGPIRVFDVGDESEALQSPVQPKIGSSKNFQAIRLFDDDEAEALQSPVQPKIGSSKNFQAIRLFGDDEAVAAEQPDRLYKSHPNKYSHFSLGDENDGSGELKDVPTRPTRPMSQWDFADFDTLEKPRNKIRGQDVRHFGWSDNEDDGSETPPARPRVVQPRRDADTHFELVDDGAERGDHGAKRIIGAAHNKGLGLYESNLYYEDGKPTPLDPSGKQPSGIASNSAYRKKDFDSHWTTSDSSPPNQPEEEEHRPMSRDRVQAYEQMNASWDTYDKSPEAKKDDPPVYITQKRISRNALQRSWGFDGDE